MQTNGSKWSRIPGLVLAGALVLTGCGGTGGGPPGVAREAGGAAPVVTVAPLGQAPEAAPPATTPAPIDPPNPGAEAGQGAGEASPRPAWLGTRMLPLGTDGYGQIQPTPAELVDRRLISPDDLAPPAGDDFGATVTPPPPDVVRRSTWDPACPVGLEDLRYLTLSFWGFDGRPHTGELLVHTDVADDVVAVFGRLHEARFPIEEMRVTRTDELDAHPTGDGNNTGAFVCRPSRGTTSWSEHAYGRAVDINPFHNPYVKGEVVLPELASAYQDREALRPGMIVAGDAATSAFQAIGWGWGGHWRSSRDFMHFSANGS